MSDSYCYFGSRYFGTNSVLDIFYKYNIVFAGKANADKYKNEFKAGTKIAICEGKKVKAVGIAEEDFNSLGNLNIDFLDEEKELFEIEEWVLATKVKIFKLEEEDCFEYDAIVSGFSPIYKRKDIKDKIDELIKKYSGEKMKEEIKELLLQNENLILTGAPGTGKTHLAKQIANEMIKGETDKNPNDIIRNYYEEYKNELEEYFNECERLRQEFIKRFPKEELKSISIEDYSVGRRDAEGKRLNNSFCYWIEFKLRNSGFFDCGTANSYLLYYDKNGELKNTTKNKNDDELIKEIGEAIYKMSAEKEYNGDLKFKGDLTTIKFAMKIYNSYNPYYYFPIFSSDYMNNICEIFNIEKDKNPYKQNLNIKEYFETHFKDIKLVIIKEILIRNFDLKNGIVNKNNNTISLEGKIGFVQFHPSYDYTDFVEGLRPIQNEKGDIVFERKDGVFKEFCKEALNNQSSNFVFIIDEINRGEISKIFGELFFSVDSGYRGEKGKVLTQYANLIEDRDEFKDGFYIPENVFIIGTMNDIDRSVESMDFAMRRRFAWKEIKAKDTQETILSDLGDLKEEAIKRMDNLNNVIRDEETNLSEAYCIGAAYFKKIKDYEGDFNKLWDNHLNGLLFEYTRGMSNQREIMIKLKDAYNSNSDNDTEGEEEEIIEEE